MHVILQKTADLRFFRADGNWTNEITEAFVFPNLATATLYSQNQGLLDVRFVLGGDGCPYNIPVNPPTIPSSIE